MEELLELKNLKTSFKTIRGKVTAVDGVSFKIGKGEIVGIVGESGCGKSVTSQSIMRLYDEKELATYEGEVLFEGENLLEKSEKEMQDIRGDGIAMIFQDALSSLNPLYTVGNQIAEVVLKHKKVKDKKEAYAVAEKMLRLTGIPAPEERVNSYPHEMSGGMRQRAMIAMALACEPKLLIADEPTTALDVTIQAQIMNLIVELNKKLGMGIMLITHDLGVVAQTCQRVIIMYLGHIVEEGLVTDIFDRPIAYCKNIADEYADETEVMECGNLIATFKGKLPGKTVMISAHTDEVGYIVKSISEKGFIYFEKTGGPNLKTLPAHRMLIQGTKGILVGVVGITPGHIQKSDEASKVPSTSESYIDIGAVSYDEAVEMGVEIGSRIVPDSEAMELNKSDIITGRAIDDRIGCAVLLHMCRTIDRDKICGTVKLVFSVMEEIYVLGAAMASRYINPDYHILVDTFVAGGTPDISAKRLNIDIGKGPVISFIDIIPGVGASLQNDKLVNCVKEIAAVEELPLQFTTMAEDRYGGDAMAVLRNGNQKPCLTLTIPRRYSHSPSEVTDLKDSEVTYYILMDMISREIDLSFLK